MRALGFPEAGSALSDRVCGAENSVEKEPEGNRIGPVVRR